MILPYFIKMSANVLTSIAVILTLLSHNQFVFGHLLLFGHHLPASFYHHWASHRHHHSGSSTALYGSITTTTTQQPTNHQTATTTITTQQESTDAPSYEIPGLMPRSFLFSDQDSERKRRSAMMAPLMPGFRPTLFARMMMKHHSKHS